MNFETQPQETYATLRIYHAQLEPEQLTALFEIKPTMAWKMGDQIAVADSEKHNNAPSSVDAQTGGWLLSSKHSVRSTDAMKHIDWVANQLANHGSSIHKLQQAGYTVDLVVAWFSDSWNTGPALTPELMLRLANLRIPLWFDVYLDKPMDLSVLG
ncbi:hypothetical protein BH11CYA1_BH11CYA1_28780 [soil metagenome]